MRYLRFLEAGCLMLLAVFLIAGRPAGALAASIEVYPGPGGGAYQSNLYKVDVYDGANWQPSYVYGYSRSSVTLWHQGAYPSVNFTTFGTTGTVSVRITRLAGSISSISVSPQNKHFPVSYSNGQAIVTLNQNDKAWVTINGDDADPLLIFADPPKAAVPQGATYFGPGVYDIASSTADHYQASSNEVIYLDGGAWVKGNINVRGTTGVKIMGPGVLSGDVWTAENVQALGWPQMSDYAMVIGDWGGYNADVQNITIVDSPTYNFYGGTHNATDVKLISPWYYSTDGFQGVNNVDNIFAFIGDNVFFPIWAGIDNDNITVTNSFAGTTNNSVFCGGFWGNQASDSYTATANNIDIKTYNSDAWVQYGSPLTPALTEIWMDNNDSTMGYNNQTYQNIRVEGSINLPLVQLKNYIYPWGGGPNPPLGNGSNITFNNVSLGGTQKDLSEITGLDSADGFHNIIFNDLNINGRFVTQASSTNYFSTNGYVSNLAFTVPPVISNIATSSLTQTSVTVNWTTNEAATSQLQFQAPCPAGGCTTNLDPNLVTSHSVNVTGLATSTTYSYNVLSQDAYGNSSTSTLQHFTTLSSNLPPTNGLVGYWKFEEGSGTTTVDTSGKNNTGFLINNPAWVAGKVGSYSLKFDGATQYVKVNSSSTLQFGSGSFSFGSWFNSTSSLLSNIIANNAVSGNKGGWQLLITNGQVQARITDGTHQVISSSSSVKNNGAWHYAMVVIDRSARLMHLYVDNVEVTPAVSINSVGSVNSDNSQLNFAANYNNGAYQFFAGSLDEVRIYNRTLTTQEISNIYNFTGP